MLSPWLYTHLINFRHAIPHLSSFLLLHSRVLHIIKEKKAYLHFFPLRLSYVSKLMTRHVTLTCPDVSYRCLCHCGSVVSVCHCASVVSVSLCLSGVCISVPYLNIWQDLPAQVVTRVITLVGSVPPATVSMNKLDLRSSCPSLSSPFLSFILYSLNHVTSNYFLRLFTTLTLALPFSHFLSSPSLPCHSFLLFPSLTVSALGPWSEYFSRPVDFGQKTDKGFSLSHKFQLKENFSFLALGWRRVVLEARVCDI